MTLSRHVRKPTSQRRKNAWSLFNHQHDYWKNICRKIRSYADVEVRRTEKLKAVTSSLNVYETKKQEEVVAQVEEKAKVIPMFNPGDAVTTKRTLSVGKMYDGFMFGQGMGVWKAVVCNVHEWEHSFYYTLDNQKSYSEEMLEVYQPWKKPLASESA